MITNRRLSALLTVATFVAGYATLTFADELSTATVTTTSLPSHGKKFHKKAKKKPSKDEVMILNNDDLPEGHRYYSGPIEPPPQPMIPSAPAKPPSPTPQPPTPPSKPGEPPSVPAQPAPPAPVPPNNGTPANSKN
jgi:hypothetical protein